MTTRRLPSGKDESRAATLEVTKRREIPTVSNRRSRVICRLVIVVVSCTEMMFSQFWPVTDLYYICLFWKRYIFASCPLNYVSRRKMFCRFSRLALILVKVSGMLLLIDVFICFSHFFTFTLLLTCSAEFYFFHTYSVSSQSMLLLYKLLYLTFFHYSLYLPMMRRERKCLVKGEVR